MMAEIKEKNSEKVALVISTFNKEHQIENTLYGILRQETNFPFEVYIVDDASEKNPEVLIHRFFEENKHRAGENFIGYKFKRLKKNSGGGRFARKYAFEILTDDIKIIVSLTSDTVMLNSDCLQILYDRVEKRKPVFAEVIDYTIKPTWYKNFDEGAENILNNWNEIVQRRAKNPQLSQVTGRDGLTSQVRMCAPVSRYSAVSWIFHCGAIYRSDCVDLEYAENSCDAVISEKMNEKNYSAEILTGARTIHQAHIRKRFACKLDETCRHWCPRTQEKQGRRGPPKQQKAEIV